MPRTNEPDNYEPVLSAAIERAFDAKFGEGASDISALTRLAENIQRSLDNKAGLIGDGYRVRFATSGTGSDTVLKTNPAVLNIIRKDGQTLCSITVLNLQTAEFEVKANTDIVTSRSIPTIWRRNGLSSLLDGLATVVVASISEVDYLKTNGPAQARKFMPGTP